MYDAACVGVMVVVVTTTPTNARLQYKHEPAEGLELVQLVAEGDLCKSQTPHATSNMTHHTSHITHHTSHFTHLGALISLFAVQPLLHLLQHLCYRQSKGVKIMFYGGSFMANGSWQMVLVHDVLSIIPLRRQHDRRWICRGRALRPPRSCRAWRTCTNSS